MGFTGTVGVVGFTLNGGLGWLSRQYGLAADHLLAIRLVTMDGQERLVSPDSHPDLFWALCGNGPSIGVVTAIQVKLHPVTEVVAGKFYFPAARAAEVLEAYRGWTATWPDTLTSVINVVTLPPYEDIPEPIRGQSVVELALCVTDSLAAAQALLAPIEQLQPLLQFATLCPYSALLGFSDDPQEPSKLAGYHLLFDELSPEAMTVLATQIVANPMLPSLILELRHLGGAIATTPSKHASFCYRQTSYLLHIIAPLDPQESPTSGAARIAALRNVMAPYASGNTLKGFLYRSDDAQRVSASYTPDTLAALVRIRQQYDPHQRQLTVLPQESDPIATAPDLNQRVLPVKN
jgi:FAD/FMN-containing dehydrogenase